MVAKSALKTSTTTSSYNSPPPLQSSVGDATRTKHVILHPAVAVSTSDDNNVNGTNITPANYSNTAQTTIAIANTTSSTQLSPPPPPLKFIEIDPNQRLPIPPPPSDKALLQQAEELVYWAISSKHENSAANQLLSSSNNNNNNTTNGRNTAIEAARRHALLTELLSRKQNPTQLLYVLHALSTSNSGRDLDRLVTNPKLHAQLVHLLLRMDPFCPGVEGGSVIRELQVIRRAEKEKQQQLLNNNNNNGKSSVTNRVKIDQSAIQHKEHNKYIAPTRPFFQYEIADVYLHLIIMLISSNSILSVSATRAIWGLLTEFGPKWMEGEVRRGEELKKWRRRRRRKREVEKKKLKVMLEESGLPVAKKVKMDVVESSLSSTTESSSSSSPAAVSVEKVNEKIADEKEEDNDILVEVPEGERIVPGMSGLCVDFVKNVFFSNSNKKEKKSTPAPNNTYFGEEEELICSDRLASGRVHRLLLTLLNIFRLCPRSKLDLLREISNNFPHYKTCPPPLYQWYSHICLQLLHLVPTMEGPIMSMFVDKALDMDVEIKIDDKGGVFLDNSGNNNGNEDKEGDDLFNNANKPDDDDVAKSPMPKKRSFQYLSQETQTTIALANNTTSNSELVDTTAEDEADHINDIAERLDTLMTVLYEHIIQATEFSPDSLSEAMTAAVNARRMYRHLDEVFDKKVRTTDRSKFVQFVFFVLFGRENDALEAVGRLMAKREEMKAIKNESLDTDLLNQMDPLYRGFSAKLIDVFFNPSYAGDVPRQTVVCYLASFVSRAKYVCPETVCECIAALLRWAEIYVTAQESQKQKGRRIPLRRSVSSTLSLSAQQQPSEVHALFYTSCQAAFYLMCFRGVEAIQYYRNAYEHRDDPDSPYADPESVDIGPQRWRFLCGHDMQPLKYCLESVRLEFLHLAEELELFLDQGLDDELPNREETKAFLDGLWNSLSKEGKQTPKAKGKTSARRRSTIISTAAIQEKKRLDGGVGGLGKGSNPLGSFFPFDPYLLQKSYQHVHPYYRSWEDCIPPSSLYADTTIDEEDEIDISADMSDIEDDLDDDDDDQVDEDGEDSDEEEDDDDDLSEGSNKKPTTNDESFEMDFRRSRAMSTGSQMSW